MAKRRPTLSTRERSIELAIRLTDLTTKALPVISMVVAYFTRNSCQ